MYTAFDFDHVDDAIPRVTTCAAEIGSWMRSDMLQFNEDKTELLIMSRRAVFSGMPR